MVHRTRLRRWIAPSRAANGNQTHHRADYHQRRTATKQQEARVNELKPVGLHGDAPRKDSNKGGDEGPNVRGAERDLEAAQRASQIPQSRPPPPIPSPDLAPPSRGSIESAAAGGDPGTERSRRDLGRAGLVGAGEPWRRRRRPPPPPPPRRARSISRPGRSG